MARFISFKVLLISILMLMVAGLRWRGVAAMTNPLDCGSLDNDLVNAPALKPTTRCAVTDRNALLEFKKGITKDSKGALSDWKSTTDCCKWSGVTCNGDTGRVVALALGGGNWLEGVISPSLGRLTSLQVLKLHDNSFTGPLPASIGSLTLLVQLCLSGSFSGSIPETYGKLSKLRILEARSSNLSGPLPSTIGGMSSLQELHIYGNHFTGPIPASFGKLTNLYTADMGSNAFSGAVPDAINTAVNLAFLFLNDNKINALPKKLSNLKNLQWVSLSNNPIRNANNLAGLATAPKLLQLELNHCQLSGHFPAWMISSYPHSDPLKGSDEVTPLLDLSFNSLSGPIPTSIGSALPDYLERLYLNNNRFTGTIPASISKLDSLKIFNVSYNNLSGRIPLKPFDASAYKGNAGLCGSPLPACKNRKHQQ